MKRVSVLLFVSAAVLVVGPAAGAKDVATFAVNDYFGVPYDREPVSFDATFDDPVPRGSIGLVDAATRRPVPCQVEIVEGAPEAIAKARVWTHVSFPYVEREVQEKRGGETITVTKLLPGATEERHKRFTVVTGAAGSGPGTGPLEVRPMGREAGRARMAVVSNGRFWARVPVEGVRFDPPASAFDVPGPVVSVSRDGREWIGSGYLDGTQRVESVACETDLGPIYFESRITYGFEGGRTYTSRVRLYAAKPYVRLVEDFDVGGPARYVFNFNDWFADAFFDPGDHRLYGWQSITAPYPADPYLRFGWEKALARLVIWSQFNYFGGKQETIALKAPDPEALEAAHREAVERYRRDLDLYHDEQARYKAELQTYEEALRDDEAAVKRGEKARKPKGPREPRRRLPREPEKPAYHEVVYRLGSAPIRTTGVATPGGDSTAVGAFYVRPDRWTRAKMNHVDLYMRPEVPGDRSTRGLPGREGARQRIAMEAWLTEGHREWAVFAVRSGDATWLAKAHVQEGVWPLDRLSRLTLVWNSDGTPVAPEHTMPPEGGPVGGTPGRVLLSTRGRSGLQTFNGSEGGIRGTRPDRRGWDGTVTPTRAADGDRRRMIDLAMTAYMAADESAYPSVRAMLPWTHPEAINPFYQGMENMNFNADLYRYVTTFGLRLAELGHPEAMRFIKHGETSLDMALDRYVYPGSGCWEESHGYASHTIHTVHPLVEALAGTGLTDFREDLRFARMVEFFLYVHSPIDAEFGNRVVPPVGDHGLSEQGPAKRFGGIIDVFAGAKDPEVKRIVRRAAWMVREDGSEPPEGIEPERPDLSSRWLRGYGTVMRARTQEPTHQVLTLRGAIVRGQGEKADRADLHLRLPLTPGGAFAGPVRGKQPAYNTAQSAGTIEDRGRTCHLDLTVGDDKWVKGGKARYVIDMSPKAPTATYRGEFGGRAVEGPVFMDHDEAESFLVLRAGQSWGHHHEDKGSMWFWGRNVHFFGDCDWGGPPGGTYWNQYKQGPASGTQIEFVGVNNWTLPCKFPAPWISDDEYDPEAGYDYANARCLYPYNPPLDLSTSSPAALRNGYDRQVLFVHPDVLVVRDNVETVCPTIWRLHSYQPEKTTAEGGRATLGSPQGVTGHLAILHPAEGVKLRLNDRDILNDKYHDADGNPLPFDQLPKFKRSVELRWDMPPNTSATWVFAVQGEGEKVPKVERLDEAGRVTRVRLGDGTEIVTLVNIEPFAWSGEGIEFEGTVGLVVRKDGKTAAHPIRAKTLKAGAG